MNLHQVQERCLAENLYAEVCGDAGIIVYVCNETNDVVDVEFILDTTEKRNLR